MDSFVNECVAWMAGCRRVDRVEGEVVYRHEWKAAHA